jgi:hypothetical protein
LKINISKELRDGDVVLTHLKHKQLQQERMQLNRLIMAQKHLQLNPAFSKMKKKVEHGNKQLMKLKDGSW